jgi:hypothetical protein
MVLFPIAFIWLLAVMIWLIRNSLNNEPGELRDDRTWTRWRPRPPRRPSGGQSPSRAARFANMRSNSRS